MSYMPNWAPSQLSTLEPSVPNADKFSLFNPTRRSSLGIDKRIYGTAAEAPEAVTPFLKKNMVKDHRTNYAGRTYLVGQGGDTFYDQYDPVTMDLAYEPERLPVPKQRMAISVNAYDDEPLRFGPANRSRVRGQLSSKEYQGHYDRMYDSKGIHRDRYFGTKA